VDIDSVLTGSDTAFHYTKMSTALEHILHSGKLRVSQRTSTNDPFEWPFSYIPIGATLADRTMIETIRRRMPEAYELIFNAVNKNTWFVSFCNNKAIRTADSRPPDPREGYGFLKPRMWSQYGEGSKGVCLAFSKNALVEIAERSFPLQRPYSGDVDYVHFKDFELGELHVNAAALANTEPEPFANWFLETFNRQICFRKHVDYKDEQEFRLAICTTAEMTPTAEMDIAPALQAIIVNYSKAEPYMKLLCEHATHYKVKLFEINWENQKIEVANVDCHRPPGST